MLRLLQNIKNVVVDYHLTVTQRVHMLRIKYLNDTYAKKASEY